MTIPKKPQQPTSIDEYMSTFPPETRIMLEKLRTIIHSTAPAATETISYAMPTFKLGGNLVHFAGYKNHIGFYPTPSAIVKFGKELSMYKTSKGAIQLPIDKPLPVTLIERMVKFRVAEMGERT